MVNYTKLGYNSINEYNRDFFGKLLETNHTYDFFVNWEKVYDNLDDFIIEIGILNTLSKVESYEVESHFRKILKQYPQVVSVLPIIIAIRSKNISVLDIDNTKFKKIKFTNYSFDIDEIVDFSKKTGLLAVFSRIDDLYSYLVGVEVGLDTNARKSRSGHIFEDIVGRLLENKINDKPEFRLAKEDTIPFERTKRWDYVIYKNDKPKLFFECNFYNSGGSKPIETAHAYVDLQKQLKDTEYTFIWVTDGQGWNKMSKALKEAAVDIDYVLNYRLLDEYIDLFLE